MAKALEPAAEDASVTIDADVVMVKNMQKVVMKMQYTVSRTKESPNTSGLSIRPDLALFGELKQHLGSKHCADDDDVQHEVLLWMRQQPKEFYAAVIGALIKRWDKSINIGGEYVEK
ncbi:hypothetical protein AVEN_226434-1 [Araneus ventricosus]|uniref:Uncharacterized protein n=1 Tax=Araneus ventricosus TaxID=182803 RepID=A0A4Y2MGQ7_ARAVE|nr:hypothetical protein AVEN_226434-1 [Araneus ventricosus]